MNKKTAKALIKGGVTITVAVIGAFTAGMKLEQRNTQTQINEVMGDVINVTGDDNDITINDIATLTQNYIQLQSDYDSLNQQKDALVEQNTKYFNELTEANNTINELNAENNQEIKDLHTQLASVPAIAYKSLSLSIDADDIPISANNSMVTIDGRDYFSREIVENLVPDNKSITIKDSTIFIGQVVVDKANLFEQRVFEQDGINIIDAITDSFGNNYSKVLYADTNNGFVSLYTKYITYYLDGKYSYLKISVAVRDNVGSNTTGILTIRAGDDVVYTSESLDKKTKPFTKLDIPIHNCDFLTIEYVPNNHCIDCIIFNAEIYN